VEIETRSRDFTVIRPKLVKPKRKSLVMRLVAADEKKQMRDKQITEKRSALESGLMVGIESQNSRD
jgi:hypothetical protein